MGSRLEGDVSKQSVELDILGMTCASCAVSVERGVRRVDGVESASVNIATERALVTFDPTLVDAAQLIGKVRDTGYDVRVERIILPIGGMACAACVATRPVTQPY